MSTKTQKRKYKKVTPRTVAQHAAQVILSGNNAAAVRDTDGDYGDGYDRGHYIAKKSKTETAAQYIDSSLEQIAGDAMQTVHRAVLSKDARIGLKASTYVIDHIRGKAVQRSISLTGRLNIQNVLDS